MVTGPHCTLHLTHQPHARQITAILGHGGYSLAVSTSQAVLCRQHDCPEHLVQQLHNQLCGQQIWTWTLENAFGRRPATLIFLAYLNAQGQAPHRKPFQRCCLLLGAGEVS